MKKLMVFIIAILVFCPAVYSATGGAFLIASADSNAAALDVNDTSWEATAAWKDLTYNADTLKIKFYVYDPCGPNNTTFSYQIYAADYGCNAELVAVGTATCGAASMSHNPINLAELNSGSITITYCWVDTLGSITEDWETTAIAQNDAGANGVASLLINRQSARRIWCRIFNRSSATMTVVCVGCDY